MGIRTVHTIAIRLGQALLLAAIYFGIGRLAMQLAISPGVASMVFPPTGIALVAILIYGYRMALGVLFGSLALNLYLLGDLRTAHPLGHGALLATAVAAGATLQAIVGAWLVRRFVGFPTPLQRDRDVVRFLVLGGPFSCLIAVTIGVSLLCLTGVISPAACRYNWFAWWVGDSIGVLVFAPLMMVLLAPPRDAWRSRWLTVGVPLCIATGLAIASFVYTRAAEQENARLRFVQQATTFYNALMASFDEHIESLQSIVSFYDSSVEVTRVEFHTFVANSIERHPDLRALEWVPRVRAADRDSYEQGVQLEANDPEVDWGMESALKEFQITEQVHSSDDEKILVRAGPRDEYYPVCFVEPFIGNEPSLGYDLGSDAPRLAAIVKARDTGMPTATEKVRLVQAADNSSGILVILPVYSNAHADGSVDAPQRHLQGFAVGVNHVDDIIGNCLRLQRKGILLQIRDPAAVPERQLVYSEVDREPTESELATNAVMDTHFTDSLADRAWTIRFIATPEYLATQRSWQAWAVLAGALISTSLLGALLLVMTGHASQVEALVAERTDELTQTNVELARSNEDLAQFAHVASHDLQEPLRAVTGFCQLLHQKFTNQLGEEGNQYIRFVVEGTGRMQTLLTDLLTYSRVSTHGKPLRLVDCNELFSDTVANLQAQIDESKASVTADPLPTVRADATQLRQLLQNLIGNAIKYCENAQPEIQVSATRHDGEWVFIVRDNGIGIDEAHCEQIFDIFQRLHTRDTYPGTGVGLAICKRIVERHHGRIWVESEPGRGSTFCFTIPERTEQADEHRDTI